MNLKCDRCGRDTPQVALIYDANTSNLYCAECYGRLGTCASCQFAPYNCMFMDKSIHPELLPFVTKRVQQKQGNMVFTQTVQVSNNDRVKAVCEAMMCHCYDKENYACSARMGDWCPKYIEQNYGNRAVSVKE